MSDSPSLSDSAPGSAALTTMGAELEWLEYAEERAARERKLSGSPEPTRSGVFGYENDDEDDFIPPAHETVAARGELKQLLIQSASLTLGAGFAFAGLISVSSHGYAPSRLRDTAPYVEAAVGVAALAACTLTIRIYGAWRDLGWELRQVLDGKLSGD